MTASTSSSAAPPLAKYLASTDKKTRDKAIKNLSIFLSDSSRDAIPEQEMGKLWKGIFYCFWMSDKPLVQQALASELAELILTISTTSSSLAFLGGFWETTVREWNGIDRLRIDKYYMLVRRFVNATFRLLLRANWDPAACQQYNQILTRKGGPLCPSDLRVPAGLSYHLAEIYLEELDKVLGQTPPAPLGTLLSPFFVLAARTPTNTTYKHLQASLFEPILSCLSSPSESDDDGPPPAKRMRSDYTAKDTPYPNIRSAACYENSGVEGAAVPSKLRAQLLRRIFEVASDPETRDSNRRKMYALWKDGAEDGDDDES